MGGGVVTSFYKSLAKRKDRQTDAFEIRYRAPSRDTDRRSNKSKAGCHEHAEEQTEEINLSRGEGGGPKAQSRDNFSAGSKLTGRAILRESPSFPLTVTNSPVCSPFVPCTLHVARDVRSWNGKLVDFQFASDRSLHFYSFPHHLSLLASQREFSESWTTSRGIHFHRSAIRSVTTTFSRSMFAHE